MAESNVTVTPQFVLAGEATFTVSSPNGDHYTFHVYRSEPSNQYPSPNHFIKLLTGSDNTDYNTSYAYLGMLTNHSPNIKLTRNSKYKDDQKPVRVARWALRVIWQAAAGKYQLSAGYSIRHLGRCGRCGRPLTTPESLSTGLGPECASQLGVEWKDREAGRQPDLVFERPRDRDNRRVVRLERSMAQGVTDEQWTRMTEAERWEAIGEHPGEPDAYEPGGPGWVHG